MRIRYLLCLIAAFCALSATAASVRVTSPDRHLVFTLSPSEGALQYNLSYQREILVQNSSLGFDSADIPCSPWKIGQTEKGYAVEEYVLPVGKKSHVRESYNDASVPVYGKGDKEPFMYVHIKVFNDAAAFRYEFCNTETLQIRNELMEIRPSGTPLATALFVPGFINTHEGPYTRVPLPALEKDRLIDMPLLLEYPSGRYLAIMEANLVDYAGMYLVCGGGNLKSRLSPRLDIPGVSVLLDAHGRTPWRVFQVADRPGALIESTVLTSLADPCKVEDTSWLKPGKTTFPWWNDTAMPDTTFQRGNNFLTNKYYIDFAADHNLEYHSVYGYADMPWYTDDGPGFGLAGPNADLTRPASVLDFPAVCRYAASRGVDIHVWLNWAALYKDIDRVFDQFNIWGVKGMMVDFMDRDDQEMIHIQETILRKAAEHRLFIQFHGASKPSGLWRTWPNEFTREGTLNYEVYKWDTARLMGPDHDIMMPFTRLLAGPADYHLGGFRSLPPDKWRVRYTRPFVTGTRSHMLAMYIVMESYLSMVCDEPDAYRGQPGFDFIMSIPTRWDDTVVPDARVSEYVAVARKNGEKWYLGCINNSKERTVSIPLSFLGDGKWKLRLYRDVPLCEEDPNLLEVEEFNVGAQDELPVHLASGGGCAMILTPEE